MTMTVRDEDGSRGLHRVAARPELRDPTTTRPETAGILLVTTITMLLGLLVFLVA